MFIKFDLDISRVSRILSLGLARIISSWCFSCSLRSSLVVMKMVWHLDHHHTSQTMKYHKTSNKIGHYWDSRKGSCLNLGKPCGLNPKTSSHQSNTPTAETYIGRGRNYKRSKKTEERKTGGHRLKGGFRMSPDVPSCLIRHHSTAKRLHQASPRDVSMVMECHHWATELRFWHRTWRGGRNFGWWNAEMETKLIRFSHKRDLVAKILSLISFGLKNSKGKLPNHQASTGWSWKIAKILMNFKVVCGNLWHQSDNFCTRYLNFGELITSERRFQRVRGKLPIANPESSHMSSTVEITWYNIWVSVFYHSFTTCSFILNSIYLFFKSWSSSWDCDSGRPSGRTGFGSGRRSGGGRLGKHETGGRNTLVLWIRARYPGVKSGPVWYGSGGKGCRDVSPGVWPVRLIFDVHLFSTCL